MQSRILHCLEFEFLKFYLFKNMHFLHYMSVTMSGEWAAWDLQGRVNGFVIKHRIQSVFEFEETTESNALIRRTFCEEEEGKKQRRLRY